MPQVLFIDGPLRGEFREFDGNTLAFHEAPEPGIGYQYVQDWPGLKISYYHVHQCILLGCPRHIGSLLAQVAGNEQELMERVRDTLIRMSAADVMRLYGTPGRVRPGVPGVPGVPGEDREPARHYCGPQGCWYAGRGFSRCGPGECVQAGRNYRTR